MYTGLQMCKTGCNRTRLKSHCTHTVPSSLMEMDIPS